MPNLIDVLVLRPRHGVVVVECTGEHDLTSERELDQLFSELVTENDLVVVDVSEAEFIDSSFLYNLLKADRLARRRGTRFRLQHATSHSVRSALELSGVLAHLDDAMTREDALARTAREQQLNGHR